MYRTTTFEYHGRRFWVFDEARARWLTYLVAADEWRPRVGASRDRKRAVP
jgi:hypothetical protein